MKLSFASVIISLAGSSNVEAMALFRYKIILVHDFAWLVDCYHMKVHSNAAYRDIPYKYPRVFIFEHRSLNCSKQTASGILVRKNPVGDSD